MRRKDREVLDVQKMLEIINFCKVFRVAMSVNNIPYIVPLNYGYKYSNDRFEFYFHCANEGQKIDMLKSNNNVCFEIDCDHKLIAASSACGYGYSYKSIIGMGKVAFVTSSVEKIECLKHIMKQQTGEDFIFTEEQASPVAVCKIDVSSITAKERK